MNQDATLAQMRELKLIGMAQAFEALCLLPIDKHSDTYPHLRNLRHNYLFKYYRIIQLLPLR